MAPSEDQWTAFLACLQEPAPPEQLSISLRSLWLVKNGMWEQAHALVNDLKTRQAMHVHAHIHRLEGDFGNAAYWYQRAGEPECHGSTDEEWEALVRKFLMEKPER